MVWCWCQVRIANCRCRLTARRRSSPATTQNSKSMLPRSDCRGLLDHRGRKARKDLRERRGQWGFKVQRVTLARKACRDLRDRLVPRDQRETREPPAQPGRRVQQALQVPRVILVRLVQRARLVQRDRLGLRGRPDLRVQPERPVRQERAEAELATTDMFTMKALKLLGVKQLSPSTGMVLSPALCNMLPAMPGL